MIYNLIRKEHYKESDNIFKRGWAYDSLENARKALEKFYLEDTNVDRIEDGREIIHKQLSIPRGYACIELKVYGMKGIEICTITYEIIKNEL